MVREKFNCVFYESSQLISWMQILGKICQIFIQLHFWIFDRVNSQIGCVKVLEVFWLFYYCLLKIIGWKIKVFVFSWALEAHVRPIAVSNGISGFIQIRFRRFRWWAGWCRIQSTPKTSIFLHFARISERIDETSAVQNVRPIWKHRECKFCQEIQWNSNVWVLHISIPLK